MGLGNLSTCSRTVLGPGKSRWGPEVAGWQRGEEGLGMVEMNKVELTGFHVPGDDGIEAEEKFLWAPWFLARVTGGTVVPWMGLGNIVAWVEEITIIRESCHHPSLSWRSEWKEPRHVPSGDLPVSAIENLTPCRPAQSQRLANTGAFVCHCKFLGIGSSPHENYSAPGQAGSCPEPSRQSALTVWRHLVWWGKQPLIDQNTTFSAQKIWLEQFHLVTSLLLLRYHSWNQ